MGITKTYFKNFTVFQEEQLDFSSGINIFIGENGTGKTHLLKSIYGLVKCQRRKIETWIELVIISMLA